MLVRFHHFHTPNFLSDLFFLPWISHAFTLESPAADREIHFSRYEMLDSELIPYALLESSSFCKFNVITGAYMTRSAERGQEEITPGPQASGGLITPNGAKQEVLYQS